MSTPNVLTMAVTAHLMVQLAPQAGDTLGRINCIDPRQPKPFAQPQLHRKDKVGCAA